MKRWFGVCVYSCGSLCSACAASSAAPAAAPTPAPAAAPAIASLEPVPLDDPKACIESTSETLPAPEQPSDGIKGSLPPEVIGKIVRQQYSAFQTCYGAGRGRHPDLRGTVVMRFVIGRDGKVPYAWVSSGTTLPDCAVARCIHEVFSALEFPAPEGGIVTVSYPLILEPG